MMQNYITMDANNPDGYRPLEFYSCVEENVPEEVLGSLSKGPLSAQPRFLIYVGGEKKDEIKGADFTALQSAINRHKPTTDE